MKRVLRSAATLALVLGITATSFAVATSSAETSPAITMEKTSADRKLRKPGRRAKGMRYRRGPSVIRVHRVTRPQVREFYRRMLDIYVN